MGCVGGVQKKGGLKDGKSAAAAQVEPAQEKSTKDKQNAANHVQSNIVDSALHPQNNHQQPPESSAIDKAKQHSNLRENVYENPPAEVHPGHHSFLSEKEHNPAKPASIIKETDPRLSNSLEKQAIAEKRSGVQSRGISEIRSSIKNQLRSGLQSIHEQDQTVREEGQYNFSIPTKGLNLHVQIN